MRGLFSIAALSISLLAMPASAQDAYPSMIGTWMGTGDGVFVTQPGPDKKASFRSVPITLVIDEQMDRRFAGTLTMGKDAKPIVGVISLRDMILWSEPGGFVEGQLVDGDTFEGCYVRVSAFSQLAACEILKRQK